MSPIGRPEAGYMASTLLTCRENPELISDSFELPLCDDCRPELQRRDEGSFVIAPSTSARAR
jgi:hypothetical protein